MVIKYCNCLDEEYVGRQWHSLPNWSNRRHQSIRSQLREGLCSPLSRMFCKYFSCGQIANYFNDTSYSSCFQPVRINIIGPNSIAQQLQYSFVQLLPVE